MKTIYLYPSALLLIASMSSNCGKYAIPQQGKSTNISSSINDGGSTSNNNRSSTTTEGNRFQNNKDDFIALRNAVDELNKIIKAQNIPMQSNPENMGATDPKRFIFTQIRAVNSEINRLKGENTRLQNSRKDIPAVQPSKSQEKKHQSEINRLNIDLENKERENVTLGKEVQRLNDKIQELEQKASITLLKKPDPELEPEVIHYSKVQLKKSKEFTRSIQVKGDVISFNFKFEAKDIKTSHPSNSFYLESNGKMTFLVIKNSKSFWSNSNELIVWGKKTHHSCIDRDGRNKD